MAVQEVPFVCPKCAETEYVGDVCFKCGSRRVAKLKLDYDEELGITVEITGLDE